MELKTFIRELCGKGEGTEVEFKSAKGGFPGSLWETYSAFGNTNGGIIVLGIAEKAGKFFSDGLSHEDAVRYKKIFWDAANNRNTVNACIVSEANVLETEYEGGFVLIIKIPRVEYSQRPIYLTLNPFGGHVFVRRHEGDYKVDDDTVRRMIADSDVLRNPLDSHVFGNFEIGRDIDPSTIRQYRNDFNAHHKNAHPWQQLDDLNFLAKIGAYHFDKNSGEEGFTFAGILMFGTHSGLNDIIPGYFVDYREKMSDDPYVRWTDRVYPDGYWEPNLYQFYKRVYLKMRQALPIPFQMEGRKRIDDTPACKALREAIVNTLIHAQYGTLNHIVLERYPDRLYFENPGTMLISVEDYFEGGHSVCRNKSLQGMFMHIGDGEKAGSGADTINKGWQENGWPRAQIKECYQPDRVEMTLNLGSLTTNETTNENLGPTATRILDLISSEPTLTAKQIAEKLGLGIDNTRFHIRNLKAKGIISHIGPDKTGHWEIIK